MPIVATDYPLLNIVWTMLVFFAWVIWFWMLIAVLGDVFGRHDIGGGKKVLWTVVVIVLPFLGVFCYLGANGRGMAERKAQAMQAQQSAFNDYVKSVAGAGAAEEIERAKGLLDSGAISQDEFNAIKQRTLAAQG